MDIKTTNQNGIFTLKLDGWLDTLSSPELGKAIDAIESATSIVLDFDKVEYISSSGLRQVVACHKKAKDIGAAFSIINVCNEAMSIFKLTGINKKLDIEEKK